MGDQNRAVPQGPEGGTPMPEPTFPNVGEPDDSGAGEGGGEELTLEQRFEAMQKAQEEERRQFAEERRQWNERFDRLLQGQGQPQQPQQQPQGQPQPQHSPQPEGVDLSGLPDPVDKPQEYHAALQQRVNQAMQRNAQALSQSWQQQQEQFTQRQTQEQRLNALWGKFQSTYADLADKEATLNGAVQAEINGMKARGIDPQYAIFADEDGFMRNVADRMRKELGIAPANGDNDHNNAGNPGAQQQLPPNRTQGLGTGTKQGGAGSKGEGKYPGFVSQLKQTQMKDGLI